jgi:hypothetical protein
MIGKTTARIALGGALVFAAALIGCGGSGGSGDTGSSTTDSGAAGPGGQISASVRACLKRQGVNLPSAPAGGLPRRGAGPPPGAGAGGQPPFGGPGGSGQDAAKLQSAFKKCGAQAPQGGPPQANSAAFRSSVSKFTSCMAKNGYKLPRANLSGNGPVFNSSQVNRKDPKFIAASRKCSSLLRGGVGPPPGA